jgi:hypothetical protein
MSPEEIPLSDRIAPLPAIRFSTSKHIPQEDVDRANEVFTRVLAHAPEPVLSIQVTLSVLADPAAQNPAMASIRVDLNGRPVNAHAAAPVMGHAIALAGDRLRIRLERMSRTWEARRGRHHAGSVPSQGA